MALPRRPEDGGVHSPPTTLPNVRSACVCEGTAAGLCTVGSMPVPELTICPFGLPIYCAYPMGPGDWMVKATTHPLTVWKRAAAAAEMFGVLDAEGVENQVDAADGRENRTRQFLMRVANNQTWTFNVSYLYWHIFRRWGHLRSAGGMENGSEPVDETVLLEQAGQKVSLVKAYPYRGRVLQGLSLYDYMSLVTLK